MHDLLVAHEGLRCYRSECAWFRLESSDRSLLLLNVCLVRRSRI